MNGGTSIASAIQKAGQLLKTVDRAAQPPAADDGAEAADHQGPAAAMDAEEAGPGHVPEAMDDVVEEAATAVSAAWIGAQQSTLCGTSVRS